MGSPEGWSLGPGQSSVIPSGLDLLLHQPACRVILWLSQRPKMAAVLGDGISLPKVDRRKKASGKGLSVKPDPFYQGSNGFPINSARLTPASITQTWIIQCSCIRIGESEFKEGRFQWLALNHLDSLPSTRNIVSLQKSRVLHCNLINQDFTSGRWVGME